MGREPERLCELDVKQREGVQKRKETLEWGKAPFFGQIVGQSVSVVRAPGNQTKEEGSDRSPCVQ